MTKLAYSITTKAITVFVQGRLRIVAASAPNYDSLAKALRQPDHDVEAIANLCGVDTFLAQITFGKVEVGENSVRYNGKPVHSSLPKHILRLLRDGHDVQPLLAFMDKLMTNPTESARNELFDWLDSGNNPITPEGNFLAFKKVRSDYRDFYKGEFDNSPGKVVEMDRSKVDPNRHNHCSVGLHFCSYGYLSSYHGGQGRTVIVEINPADVVSIPTDYQFQKGRTFRYKVLSEITEKEAAIFFNGTSVVDTTGIDSQPSEPVTDSPAPSPAFKTDEIIVCEKREAGDSLTVGKEYKVLGLNDEGDEVVVIDDDGDEWSFSVDNFVLKADKEADAVETVSTVEKVETTTTTTVKKAATLFKHGDRSFTSKKVVDTVSKHGQRGAERVLGVPRSTIQNWLKVING